MPREIDLYRRMAQVANNPTNTLGASTAAAIAGQSPPNLVTLLEDALEDFANNILNAIDSVTGLNLEGFAEDLESLFGSGDLLEQFVAKVVGIASSLGSVVGEIESLIEGVGGTVITDVSEAIKTVETDIENLPATVEAEIAGALTGVENLVTNPIGTIEGWVSALEKLLGLGGGSTGANTGGGSTIATNTFSLAQLISAVQLNQTVSASQLAQLAPSTSPNVLTDPGFTTGNNLQGQGLWCWDSWVGTGDFSGPMGCVRTVRPGRITIYNIVGTSQGVFFFIPVLEPGVSEPVDYGANGQVMAYLQIPEDDPTYGFLHTAFTWALTKTDQNYFEWVNVPYPAAEFPMGESVNAGVQWLINQINQTPGPFFFTMDSQGNQVGSAVYDEIRFGSLQNRRNDFLGATAMGNLRREEGHMFPGCADLAPGTSGMCVVNAAGSIGPYGGQNNSNNPQGGNLIDTEDLWWDFAVPGDYFACTPLSGSTVIPPADVVGGNVGDIAGIPAVFIREFYRFINFQFAGDPSNLVTDVLQYIESFETGGLLGDIVGFFVGIFEAITIAEDFAGAVYQQINNLGGPDSPHQSYYKDTQPLLAQGDDRTFLEIAVDYLNSFIGGVHPDGTPILGPPANGTQHQLLGQRVASAPGDVIAAGASVMWINVSCPGPAIAVAVNAYDSGPTDPNANLIATITADACVISNPEPSSNWGFVPLQAEFVMPTGTQSACLVFDVYPEAMTTGIVWFDDAIFEPTNLVDGALLNVATLEQITGQQVSGPQGIADMATFVQNLLDGLASANGQTNYTGTMIAAALQSQAQLAAKALLGYNLGVVNNQILSNVSSQPLSSGMQQSGQSTFPLPTGTLPTASIAAGTSLIGFINSNQNVSVGFIEFESEGTSASGVYVNIYVVDTTAGTLTNLWSSSDVSAQIASSWGWVGINIPTADQFSIVIGDVLALEIVAQSTTISVVAQTWGHVSNPNWTLPNQGASRTTSSTGGISPPSLTGSDIAFGGTAPYLCMDVSDVPPTYEPPDETPFLSAGMFEYSVPAWLLSGDYLDSVLLGAGGGGGFIAGSTPGQGGEPGVWLPRTLVYGTDIPDSVTSLRVFVGAGGAPAGAGGSTIIGYGDLTTPTFDAVGTGAATISGNTASWSHIVSGSNTAVIVFVGVDSAYRALGIVTFGGETMSCLGTVVIPNSNNNGRISAYGLLNAPTGTSTVTVTHPIPWLLNDFAANSVSYANVLEFGAAASSSGVSVGMELTMPSDANQMVAQAFGTIFSPSMNGYSQTSRWLHQPADGGTGHFDQPLQIGDAPGGSGVDFVGHLSVPGSWGAIAIPLLPTMATVLLNATGGQGGGMGNASNPADNGSNPANSNGTSSGLGPGNQTWAGRLYVGGPSTLTTHLGGNQPGGGSAGGDGSFAPTNGAAGGVWLTARQGNSTTAGGSGFSGGGSELSVIYEATGAGGKENLPGVNSLSWSHTSVGGTDCAVILIGAVGYSAGAASPAASYGSSSFTQGLEGITYYNSAGDAVFLFALGVIGVPSGTQTVTLGATGATINGLAGITVSYQNVGSFGNFYTNNGAGTSLSLSDIASASGEMVVAGFADIQQVIGSFSQTSRWNQNDTTSIPMLVGDAPGASSVSFTATSASDTWGAIGGVLIPPS